ncbi:unnamed protein product [Hanseniaspora opuntiae]
MENVAVVPSFKDTTVLLIDNYDSFTWNIYEYIIQQNVKSCDVIRNDKITLDEIRAMDPDIIVISPGPGHPITDSGISCDVINAFKGIKPIFGVCMGQECMIQLFGGDVVYAGEIVHGKTSTIKHDQLGCFKNISQGIAVTRYHSLAAEKSTIPECFEITALTEESKVIMGVRHKEYIIEGVQFHPESILTEQGHLMIRNMLRYKGYGTWDAFYQGEHVDPRENTPSLEDLMDNKKHRESILDVIFQSRKDDYDALQSTPGLSFKDLELNYELIGSKKYNRINLYDKVKIRQCQGIQCANKYANGHATVISCLTEPKPLVLRKDFIFSEYQILEAINAGADTVLLIVKMLSDQQLIRLYKYCLQYNLEPLVEVANLDEIKKTLALIPEVKVIGINNRDLHTFSVNMNVSVEISNYLNEVNKKPYIIALSGILKPADADIFKFDKSCISGFLVGEGLMRTDNVSEFISQLKK